MSGKSTLIRTVSAARPKVADYPFTTLVPNLGVVRDDHDRNFVMADIPGLIEGASEGAGLGFRFLKHLSRTRLLLHLVDALPADGSDPIDSAVAIVQELERFCPALAQKERWVVLNKMDLLDAAAREQLILRLQQALQPRQDILQISALNGQGCKMLVARLLDSIENHRLRLLKDAAYRQQQRQAEQAMAFGIRRSIESARASRRNHAPDHSDRLEWECQE